MFTEMKWYGMGDHNSTERAKMFAARFLQYFYNTCYNMFARRVFTIVFTIFLAECFYNVFTLFSFYKYLFHLDSRFLHYVSLFSSYSFYNVHTQGKTGVAGSPLFIRYEFLFFFS